MRRHSATDDRIIARHQEHMHGAQNILNMLAPFGWTVTATTAVIGSDNPAQMFLIRARTGKETLVEGTGRSLHGALLHLAQSL